MGVGFHSYVQYTNLDMESPEKQLIIIFVILSLAITDRFELEYQLITARLHGVGIDCFNVVVIDYGGAEIGVNSRDGQFHLCRTMLGPNHCRRLRVFTL